MCVWYATLYKDTGRYAIFLSFFLLYKDTGYLQRLADDVPVATCKPYQAEDLCYQVCCKQLDECCE
jgi:hypothetical protein